MKALFALAILTFTLRAHGFNDPLFALQWSLANDGSQAVSVNLDDLHTVQQKGRAGVDIGYLAVAKQLQGKKLTPVTVAVIDFGVDPTHPDLAGRIAPGGWNFVDASANMYDEQGHGTHVSGIIAANGDNRLGVVGIAPSSVRILPLKILNANFENFAYNGKFISEYAADAIRYATAHGASVINMSLGWPKLVDSDDARAAVREAVAKGVVVVVSAGNDRKDKAAYPCAYEGVVCVGAITNTGAPAVFTNSGGAVDVMAPGDGIVSTIPFAVESETLRIPGYEMMSGTSQASPEVAAIAATLKSARPAMSVDEVRARLMVSGAATVVPGQALSGLVNFDRAFHAQPRPVYAPDFKALEDVAVGEQSLVVEGNLRIRDLWAPASGVNVRIAINGRAAGQMSAATLDASAEISVPWRYAFASLDESSTLTMQVTVTDATGKTSTYATSFTAARDVSQIAAQTTLEVDSQVAGSRDWMAKDLFGRRYSQLHTIDTYGRKFGAPAYFRTVNSAADGVNVQVFDTANSLAALVKVPFVNRVTQVMRIDVMRDGRLDWVITGLGKSAKGETFFQFYYLAPDFKPLWPKGSAWQITPPDETQAKNIPRPYSKPGSWIAGAHGQLFPAYFASGTLPAADNFNMLDPRNVGAVNHLYYIEPAVTAKDVAVTAQLRAADRADFYRAHPVGKIMNPLPQSQKDLLSGRQTFLFAEGDDLGAKVSILDLSAANAPALKAAPTWDLTHALGLPVAVTSGDSGRNGSVFLTFTDSDRGSLTWVDTGGRALGDTAFTYDSPVDQVVGLIGAYDLGASGRFWFVESRFSLIGYHQGADGKIESRVLPIDRDSSFPGESFSELFQLAFTGSNQPGVFVDSTLVRGNLVSAMVWNQGRLTRPLRESFRIPSECLQLTPFNATAGASSFTLPFVCDDGGKVLMRFVSTGGGAN